MTSRPRRRWSIARHLVLAASILVLTACAVVLKKTADFRRVIERETARVLPGAPVDLSRPGEYRIPVRIEYPYGHGIELWLDAPSLIGPARELFDLEGAAALTKAPFPNADSPMPLFAEGSSAEGGGPFRICRLQGSPLGEYEVTVRVAKGDPALQGVPHRLQVRNSVCGCEYLPFFALRVVTLPLGIVALSGLAWACWPRRAPSAPAAESPTTFPQ